MRNRSNIIVVSALVVLSLLFVVFNGTACAQSSSVEAVPDPGTASEAVDEASDVNTTSTVSPTSAPTAKVRTLVNLNLRDGPGTNYPVVGSLPEETEVTVVGRNEDGSWLIAETESGEVWMSGHADFVNIDGTSLAALPVVEAPSPTYDASNVNVDRVLNQIPLVVDHGGHHTCASHGGLNNLLAVANGNVIGPHSGDFVLVDQGNVLFEYSNGTFQLIRENPIARFDSGQKHLPFETAMQMFASGKIVWNGTFGEWPARGVMGCDLSAKP